MRIDVLSLFPDMFKPTLGQSIVGRAQDDGFLDIHVTDFRHFTTDKHNHVDDAPFGGGAGMLLQAQPIFDAMAAIDEEAQKYSTHELFLHIHSAINLIVQIGSYCVLLLANIIIHIIVKVN